MRPVIGITPLVEDEHDRYWMRPGYMQGVEAAGGLPVMLPLTADEDELSDILSRCDGLLLTGGPDVRPSLYGAEQLPCCGLISHSRDEMERRIFPLFMAADKPVLGICRGLQVINVLCGGTLWQDLPSQRPSPIAHQQSGEHDDQTHRVAVLPDTPLHALCGKDEIGVNSYHHQGIDRLGSGLAPMGTAADGLTEAIWMPGKRFVWGVQWHPEYLYPKDEAARLLFQAFVDACQPS